MIRTRWFPATIKPAYIGVYEADWDSEHPDTCDGEWFNWFDGKRWYIGGCTIPVALAQNKKMPRGVELLRWRGVRK